LSAQWRLDYLVHLAARPSTRALCTSRPTTTVWTIRFSRTTFRTLSNTGYEHTDPVRTRRHPAAASRAAATGNIYASLRLLPHRISGQPEDNVDNRVSVSRGRRSGVRRLSRYAAEFFIQKKEIIMGYSKRFIATAATIVLSTATLASISNALGDEMIQNIGPVSYVSGGVGDDSIERLNALAADFNLKLVFAMKSGDYVSDVKITIANTAGKTLVDTTSEGPWFMTKLPAGKYQIVATFAGNAEKRTIAVGAEKLKTVDFRWSSE
jgi:hypothetical protein